MNFNLGWKFSKVMQFDIDGQKMNKILQETQGNYEMVTLPHTWNAMDSVMGARVQEGEEGYYRGAGIYQKNILLDEAQYKEKYVFLAFEGANAMTQLFVNGVCMGKHEGGYSGFRFDITSALKLGEENHIVVVVSNEPSDTIIPLGIEGDFSKMGGIYRDVKLIVKKAVHIDQMDYGSKGLYITPTNISEDRADLVTHIRVVNEKKNEEEVKFIVVINDQEGNRIGTTQKGVILAKQSHVEVELLMEIQNPILWQGRENPYLYTMKVYIECRQCIVDEVEDKFGIRTYEIDAEKGLILNGKPTEIVGVGIHQDSYEAGWAMTNAQNDRDYKMIMDMGCTGVRMAHYQHRQYEYELCDSLGLVVWSEIPLINKITLQKDWGLTDQLKDNIGLQLIEMIKQNYNHPSIVVWGISNELHQITDEIFEFYKALVALAKGIDDTRKITFADNQFWGKFLELPGDVMAYNRYCGWYKEAGSLESLGEWLDRYHHKNLEQPMGISEYGGGGAISQHKDHIEWEKDIDACGERHYEAYQAFLHEDTWAQLKMREWLWCKFVWCMFDFASNGRNEGDTKGQNDKGLATRERVPKDAYFFYQSVWRAEPMVHLCEKRFTRRPSLVPQVKIYTNADYVRLFVNGNPKEMICRKDLENEKNTIFIWKDVKLEEGKQNEVKVVATFMGEITLEDEVEWFGL